MISEEIVEDVCLRISKRLQSEWRAVDGQSDPRTAAGTPYVTYVYARSVEVEPSGKMWGSTPEGVANGIVSELSEDAATPDPLKYRAVIRAWPRGRVFYKAWDKLFVGNLTVETRYPTIEVRFRLAFEEI